MEWESPLALDQRAFDREWGIYMNDWKNSEWFKTWLKLARRRGR